MYRTAQSFPLHVVLGALLALPLAACDSGSDDSGNDSTDDGDSSNPDSNPDDDSSQSTNSSNTPSTNDSSSSDPGTSSSSETDTPTTSSTSSSTDEESSSSDTSDSTSGDESTDDDSTSGEDTDSTTTSTDPGQGDEAACDSFAADNAQELTPALTKEEAAQVVITPDATKAYRVKLEEGKPGFVTYEIGEWDTTQAFYVSKDATYTVTVAGGDTQMDRTAVAACDDQPITEQLIHFHHWTPATLEFAASGPREVWLMVYKAPK